LFYTENGTVTISLDETTTQRDVLDILSVFARSRDTDEVATIFEYEIPPENIPVTLNRSTNFLSHSVFNSHHSETEMMRYLKSLENKDLSLNSSMIPLGSCTMKLNAASE